MNDLKPSGINWIGDIPTEWETSKIKYVTILYPQCNSKAINPESEVAFLPMEYIKNGYYLENTVKLENLNGSYNCFCNEDILLAKVTPCFENGNIAIARGLPNNIGFGSSELFVIRAISCNNRFLFYLFMCPDFVEKATHAMTGVAGLKRISPDFVENYVFGLPPQKEQQAIAAFLDAKCRRIDGIIAEMEQQIDILKQYKTSLITETVTKGLNKAAPMKDSGIDWIWKIPAHWEVKRLKYLCDIKTGSTPANNAGINYEKNGYNWYTPVDFNTSLTMDESERYIESDIVQHDKIELFRGISVLIIGIGATVGKVGYCNKTFYCNQQITAMSPRKINGKYFLYFLFSQSNHIKNNALYTTLPIINNSYLANVYCLLPSLLEQQTIAAFLGEKCGKIADIITAKRQSIETMKAYKKSLIYEYVTGKKRVKGYQ
jgi:type I restriction enzyme S subunit